MVVGFQIAGPQEGSILGEQKYYRSFLEITILHANSLLVAGPICSILVNRFGCRPVMMVGGLFASLGMIMASFATNIIHIYLGIGVITGEYCFVITYEILMYFISMY